MPADVRSIESLSNISGAHGNKAGSATWHFPIYFHDLREYLRKARYEQALKVRLLDVLQ